MNQPISIHIPTPLRSFTGGAATVEVQASTVGEALERLASEHAGIRRHLFDDAGRLRRFVNVYLNDEDVRHLQQEATPVAQADTLSIVPSIAGGRPDLLRRSGAPSAAPPRPAPAWLTGADGLPAMGQDELLRYSRHLILPEVGLEGQRKLKASSVLLVGAGGLGSPAVGRIGIVDFDVVDETNLQRQVLHGTANVGRPKLDSARARLRDLNPKVRFEGYETRLDSSNALEILRPYDVIVDGTDNFPTRYLVNDACVLLGKPNVYGSVFRFEGQASVFDAKRGPCYRCLYPEPPPPGLVPSCAEGGVLGVLPGVVGLIQSIETLKLLLGIGEPLIGRLLLFDALGLRFRELKLRKDPACPICGEHPTIRELIDYEAFCGITPEAAANEAGISIGARDLAARLRRGEDLTLVDVREPNEWEIGHLPDAKLIPLNSLPGRIGELDSGRDLVLYCHTGQRSARALDYLQQAGYRRVKHLRGGIEAWSREVDPSVPRY